MTKLRSNPFQSLRCASCGASIAPADEMELEFILELARSGDTSLPIACAKCHRETTIDPKAILEGQSCQGKEGDFMYRCPEVGCPGYVCKVSIAKKKGWLCGECGHSWATFRSLESAISEIIKQFSYRARVYAQQEGHWIPSAKEPSNYETKVESELTPPSSTMKKKRKARR